MVAEEIRGSRHFDVKFISILILISGQVAGDGLTSVQVWGDACHYECVLPKQNREIGRAGQRACRKKRRTASLIQASS